MASTRRLLRATRLSAPTFRPFSAIACRSIDMSHLNSRANDTAEAYRKFQMERPLNPHMTNTNSTIANEMPEIGKDSAPPEMITSVDPSFTPKDSVAENTKRMTGGMQKPAPKSGVNKDLEVGEVEGVSFKVEPLRRTGEDANTMRARLLYQSRKRGTLESDLLLSTFADVNLANMTPRQLQQYDLFLDENDWDIYYWVTQEPTPTSMAYAEGAGPGFASPEAQGKNMEDVQARPPGTGEWAQTVGTFKPAYRPVPARWRNSEVLAMLRKHVIDRSAGGVHIAGGEEPKVAGKGLAQGVQGVGGGGLGMMPELKNFDA